MCSHWSSHKVIVLCHGLFNGWCLLVFLHCRIAVLFEWKEPFTHITACEYPEGSGDYTVLPEWYYTTTAAEGDSEEKPPSGLPQSSEASGSSGKQASAKSERET